MQRPVAVSTYPHRDVSRESVKKIDFGNASDRKWLQSHLTWCINNSRDVQICPIEDGEELV